MNTNHFSPFLGQSEIWSRIVSLIDKIKDYRTAVFISGESGTGKELVARQIHQQSTRKDKTFMAVNCGAFPPYLLESELFGHMRGAFTGALRSRPGLVEEADGGTLFLDEIADLPLSLQSKLLRLVQEKEIRRIGGNRTSKVDIRFVSATNKDIEEEVRYGRFREDLYFRLKVISIQIPPLRERKEDVLYFIGHFLEKYSRELGKGPLHFSPTAVECLLNYSWPGNVRELQNEIQRCLILSDRNTDLGEDLLSPRINPANGKCRVEPYNYFQAKSDFEKRFLNQALSRFAYNKARTAEGIGLSRQGLFKLLKKHRIETPKKREKLEKRDREEINK